MKARARDVVLGRIYQADLPELPHPGAFVPTSASTTVRTVEAIIESSGATVLSCRSLEHFKAEALPSLFEDGPVYSMIDEPDAARDPDSRDALLKIQTTVVSAEFLVLEHGALWIPALPMRRSAALFTCERLIVLVNRTDSVPTMVEAMGRIAQRPGWFICGPSKTADIEQCLVIGAQGARRISVVLLGETGD